MHSEFYGAGGEETGSMKFEYDGARDLLYIRFARTESNVARTETVRPGVHADFDVDDKLMGIEIVDATELIGSSVEFELPEQSQRRGAMRRPASPALGS